MNLLVATILIALVVSATSIPVMVPTGKSLGKQLEVSAKEIPENDLEGAASGYVVYPHYPAYPLYHYAYHYPYVIYGK
ncbi:hypothetical protein JTB14_008566 [Gonioctena quinquepunctata]|nr:hypothetical protein JTB14_008566 [Gonioctena quinquepunctata]